MGLSGKVALFPCDKNTLDIIDAATGEVVQQHEVEGMIGYSASLQGKHAAMALYNPPGVHVMNIKSGKVLCKFLLHDGDDARVALSKDTHNLTVGTDTGLL